MSVNVPSPVLARLQILFQSGATLEDAAEALELDLSGAPDLDAEIAFKAEQLTHLSSLSGSLHEHVAALLAMDQVRDLPAVAGALDMIDQRTQAIIREIEALPKIAKRQAPAKTWPETPVGAQRNARAPSAPNEPEAASAPMKTSPPTGSSQDMPAADGAAEQPKSGASSPDSGARGETDSAPVPADAIPAGVMPAALAPAAVMEEEEASAPPAGAAPKPNASPSLKDRMAAAVSQIDVLTSEYHNEGSGSPTRD